MFKNKFWKYFILVAVVILFSPVLLFSQTYEITTSLNNGNPDGLNTQGDNTNTGWVAIFDDTSNENIWIDSQPIPFDFEFYGTPVTEFKCSLNGLITFDTSVAGTPANDNVSLPTVLLPDNTIACFWDEFAIDGSIFANVDVQTFGTEPARQFWIRYASFEYSSYTYAYFSVVLEEITNKVYLIDHNYYGAGPGTATVGVQQNSTNAIQVDSSPNYVFLGDGGYAASNNDYHEFTPTGSTIDLSTNPIPVDGALDVSVEADLSWVFGAGTETYDLIFDTTYPPANVVVNNATVATTTYDPGTLLNDTVYYWQIIGRNSTPEEIAGHIWSFTTEKVSQILPFNEDFEGDLSNWTAEIPTNGDVSASPGWPYTGAQSARYTASGGMITSSISVRIEAGIDPMLSFWYLVRDNTTNDITVDIKEAGADNWTTAIWDMPISSPAEQYVFVEVDLTSYNTEDGPFWIKLNGRAFQSGYLIYHWVFIDDVAVTASGTATLDPPENLFVTELGYATWNAPATPVALWIQMDNVGIDGGASCQDFEASNDIWDAEGADDFIVPAGETWTINEVDVLGSYSGSGPCDLAHVRIYDDNAGMPGTLLHEYLDVAASPDADGNLFCLISDTPLTEGTYWISVQGRMDFSAGGQWFWTRQAPPIIGYEFHWQNPNGGFGGLTSWGPASAQWPSQTDYDLSFALYGTLSTDDGKTTVFTNTKRKTNINNFRQTTANLSRNGTSRIPIVSNMNIEDSRAFLGYNVYLDGAFIAFTTDEFYDYDDGTLVGGQSYQAEVTAVYDEGESVSIYYNFTHVPLIYLFNEDFESGTLPADWTLEYGNGTIDWIVDTGGHSGNPSAAHSGTYNALFYGGSYNPYTTMLISPIVDVTGALDLTLRFWHTQVSWGGDQDELKVYYRISNIDPWVELVHYQVNVSNWSERILVLPETSSTLQIAFEGINGYGYGVCVDDVAITKTGVFLDPPLNLAVDEETGLFTWDAPAVRALTGYDIYLDNAFVANVTDNEYLFTGLVEDQTYTAGIIAVYDEGFSDIMEIGFTYTPVTLYPPSDLSVTNQGYATWQEPDTPQIINVSPQANDYWTGSTDGSTKTANSMVNTIGDVELGWMKYDLSSIPVGATITGITFFGYVNDTNWPYWSITPCYDDPVTADALTLWDNIIAAEGQNDCYNYNNESGGFSTGWQTYNLGGTAVADMQIALSQGWFAVGCVDRDTGSSYYLLLDGWNETNIPYLEVAYEGGNDTDLLSSVEKTHHISEKEQIDNSRDLLGYNVYLDGTFVDYTTDLFWQHENLIPAETYTAGVSAVYDEGISMMINVNFTYQPITPPVNLTAEIQTFNDVLLNWDIPADDALIFSHKEVRSVSKESERTQSLAKTNNNPDETRNLIGYKVYKDAVEIAEIIDPAILTYTDFGVEPGVHEYHVTSIYDEGESDPSNIASVDIILPVPQNLIAVFVEPDVQISWDAITSNRDLAEYIVYRDGEEIASGITGTTYNDLGLAAGTYTYNVSALFDGDWESELSNDAVVEVTGINDGSLIPVISELSGNYPNPFNPTTMIKFGLHEEQKVTLVIYNIKGKKVRTLVNRELTAGYHNIAWNGKDDSNKTVSSGVYFYMMKTQNYTSTMKMVLMK